MKQPCALVLLLAVINTLGLGCIADVNQTDSPPTGVSQQRVVSGALVPTPVKLIGEKKVPVWDGGIVDLMAADVWSECSWISRPTVDNPNAPSIPVNHVVVPNGGDVYLSALAGKMEAAVSPYRPASANSPALVSAWNAKPLHERWIGLRSDAKWNVDRASSSEASAQLQPVALSDYNLPQLAGASSTVMANARNSVALAGMNLCLAQRLRMYAFQTEMLTLSEADQRQLTELVRERSQISMLQYAGILNLLRLEDAMAPGTAYKDYHVARYLVNCGAHATCQSLLTSWGQDFAAAVQLHIIAAQELAELFGRSASARTPHGAQTRTDADEQFGPGSWRQRLMALLYGGDPLAGEEQKQPPWTRIINETRPGVVFDGSANKTGLDWPAKSKLPYATKRVRDAEVHRMLTLARQFDEVWVRKQDSYTALADETEIRDIAKRMYAAVETKLRNNTRCDWDSTQSNCRSYTPLEIQNSIDSDPSGFELWNTYRITIDHAVEAVTYLSDVYASSNVLGSVLEDGTGGTRGLRLAQNAVLTGKSVLELQAKFQSMAPYRFPSLASTAIELVHAARTSRGLDYRTGDDQGIGAGGLSGEAMRIVGALPALAITRIALSRANDSPEESAAKMMVRSEMNGTLQSIIEAAIGRTAIVIRPQEVTTDVDWAVVHGDSMLPRAKEIVQNQATSADFLTRTPSWELVVDRDQTNPFWNGNANEYAFFASPRADAYQTILTSVVDPDTRIAVDALLREPGIIQGLNALSADFGARFYLPAAKELGGTCSSCGEWTFFVKRTVDGKAWYRPLTGRTTLATYRFHKSLTELTPIEAQHHVEGGFLGKVAARAMARSDRNLSLPKYDGFGFATGWVPSADPTAYGSQAGDSTMAFFLRNAKTSAMEATEAVKTAFQGLLDATNDRAALNATQKKAERVYALEREGVCGKSAKCNAKTTSVRGLPNTTTWKASPDVWPPGSSCKNILQGDGETMRKIDCFTKDVFAVASQDVRVAEAVSEARHSMTPPQFSDYEGGKLQTMFLRQWAALRKVDAAAKELLSTRDAQRSAIAAAEAAASAGKTAASKAKKWSERLQGPEYSGAADAAKSLAAAQTRENYLCEAERKLAATIFGNGNVGTPNSDQAYNVCARAYRNESVCGDWEENVRIELGADQKAGLLNARSACQGAVAERKQVQDVFKKRVAEAGLQAEYQQEISRYESLAADAAGVAKASEAQTVVLQKGNDVLIALSEVALAEAEMDRTLNEAELAGRRQELEVEFLASTQETSFHLYRLYHQYDIWRARALLDASRRYAVAARRALEARYLVDLSTMTAAEPFVAAPSLWADSAYKYDLDVPGAVGLSIQQPGGQAIYPNQILDYVGNLEKFVQGFAVTRPASAAHNDAEVINLPGPHGVLGPDGMRLTDSPPVQWMVMCPAGSRCSPASEGWCAAPSSGSFAQACAIPSTIPGGVDSYVPPLRATFSFTLDPWGQPNGGLGNEAYQHRVNARWGRFCVNLVGAGVRDCAQARDPQSCWSQPFVRYKFQHLGPAIAQNYERHWRELDVPTAIVEGGKAIAASELLDPIQNGWGRPYVEAAARSEFHDRPFGGTYVLELEAGPSVDLDKIERVQVLVSSDYWVLQQ